MSRIEATLASWRGDRALADLPLADADPDRPALVSLDIFDTLLLRRCGGPQGVFPRVARMARHVGALDPTIGDGAFALLRTAAERSARETAQRMHGSSEVDLADIYRAFPADPGAAGQLAALELAAERQVLVANPPVVDLMAFLRRCGIPVVLLSDMYVRGRDLADLLAGCGVPADLYQSLRVSCDHGASKADGGLFRALLAERPERTPGAVLHIGDDPHGDVAVPRALGLRAVPYRPAPRLADMLARERLLDATADTPLTLLRTLAAHARPADPADDGFWSAFGALVIGPAAVHYADWVLRECRAAGIGRIAPLLREGALLGDLIAHRAATAGLSVEIRPLRLSREALCLPGLTDFDEDDLRRLCGQNVFRTVGDVVRLLGVDPVPPAVAALAAEPAVDVLGGEAFATLRHRLLDPDVAVAIRARAAAARDTVADYVIQELGDAGAVAVVDFGARGTMSTRLHGIPALRTRYAMTHYLLYAVPEFFANARHGFRHRVFLPVEPGSMERARVIYRSPQFLERLLNGEEATTVGHRRGDDGRVHPVTLPVDDDPSLRRALRACRAGIDQYRAVVDRFDDPAAWPVAARDVLDVLYRAVHLPTPEEAARLGRLPYDHNDGTRLTRPLCDATARQAVQALENTVRPECRLTFALQLRPSVVPWPQGALTLEDPFYIEEMCGGSRADVGHAGFCRQLLHRLLGLGIRQVVACGAGGEGGMGSGFIALARIAGVEVAGYLDHLVPLPGDDFAGVPVVRLAGPPVPEGTAFAVASTGYGPPIVAAIERFCRDGNRSAECVWFDGSTFAFRVVGTRPAGLNASPRNPTVAAAVADRYHGSEG